MRSFVGVAAVAAALWAVPVGAHVSATTAAGQSKAVHEDETERLFSEYFTHFYSGDYAQALTTVRKLKPAASHKEGQAIVTAMRAAAILGLKRHKEAEKLFAEAQAASPDEPFVSTIAFEAGILTDNHAVAGTALDRILARFPDVVHELDRNMVWYFLAKNPEGEGRNDDRRVALAQIGYGGDRGDYLTASAIRILLARGRLDEASDLLRYIDEPEVIENMLIQRRYAQLWPAIEAQSSANLRTARQTLVERAERAFAQSPEDWSKLHQLMGAYRAAGQLDQAISLRRFLPASAEAMASADEEIGWGVNKVALALHDAGRGDEADAFFAMLNDAQMGERGGWRVSMVINRLDLLVADEKFEAALALLPAAEASARKNGNAYAQQLVRRLKFCTLARTGRMAEAARLRAELLEHSKDARTATVGGLLCANEVEEAEQVALAALRAERPDESIIRSLQRRPLTGHMATALSSGWQALRDRPEVAREFDRVARDLPEQFLPPGTEPN